MEQIAFFDARPYDRTWFDKLLESNGFEPRYLENRLNRDTAILAHGCRAVCIFVNDTADAEVIKLLSSMGVEAIALRCAGYNNVDLKAAEKNNICVFRVPAYSPASVAEHALAMLLTLSRKTHKAFTRTRERNFSLDGLCGTDMEGKTIGIVGTGKVGLKLSQMCKGLGMKVIAYDLNPVWGMGIEYVRFDELCRRSDVISLHCPLTPTTYHLINRSTFHMLKDGVFLINTSRGALIDSEALLENIKNGKVGAAGLDVYEEEADVFYEDVSLKVMRDDTLNLLLSQPNVLVTSHQAYLTDEALRAIAEVTTDNLRRFFDGKPVETQLHPHEEETVH
ncbi:MAG: 2-hydroxyacid dehydrogenase [Oscillospiraceae bacterium]